MRGLARFCRREWIAVAAIAVGLAVRMATLGDLGMSDVDQYLGWGNGTRVHGLARAFSGIYLPIQYQLFGLATQLGPWLHASGALGIKLVSLVLECGTLALLLAMAGSARARLVVVFVYWLNPWFVAMAILGYADFQLAFVIVAFLFCVRRSDGSPAQLLGAGCFVAVAVLMKPQALTIVVTLSLYAGASLVRRRPSLLPSLLVLPTLVWFAAYSWYFQRHGRSFGFLALSYRNLTSVMPSVTAHMLGFWYPIAASVHPVDWRLHDTATLWRGVSFRQVAEVISVALLSSYAWLSARAPATRWAERAPSIVSLVAYCTLVVPMTMTQAHENHLMLGTVALFVALLVETEARAPQWAAYVVLTLAQAVNVVARYGLGRNALASSWPVRLVAAAWAHPTVQWACVVASIGGFVVLFHWLWRVALARAQLRRGWAWLPTGALVAAFGVIYAIALSELAELRAHGLG